MAPLCPECEFHIVLPADTQKSEIVTCPECAVELEVKATTGGDLGDGILEMAPETREDWGE
jgi:lysine biosynthesis protein LysW